MSMNEFPAAPQQSARKSRLPLVLGIVGGAIVLIAAIIAMVFMLLGSKATMTEVKFGSDSIPTLYGVTGVATKINSYSTSVSADVSSQKIGYAESVPMEDLNYYVSALRDQGFSVTKNEENNFQLGKKSIERGKILLIDINYDVFNVEIIYRKGSGELNLFNDEADSSGSLSDSQNTSDTPTPSPVIMPVPTSDYVQDTETKDTQSSAKGSHKVFEDYGKINGTSTLADITAIIGREGESRFESSASYKWEYGDGVMLTVVFINDELSDKEIEYDDDSIFVDSAVDLSKVMDLYNRVNNDEKPTYDEFCSVLGTSGIEYSASYYSTSTVYYYKWIDTKGNYLTASFSNGVFDGYFSAN